MSADRPHLLLPAGYNRWIGIFVMPEHAGLKTLKEVRDAGYDVTQRNQKNGQPSRCTGFWFKCFDCEQCCQEVLRGQKKGQNYFVGDVFEVCFQCWRKRKEVQVAGWNK